MNPGPAGGPLRVLQWVRIRWWNACAYYAVTLAEALARAGHVSYLLAPRGSPAYEEAIARGLTVPPLGDIGSSNPVTALSSLVQLRRFLVRERIDLVNVHSGPGHLALALLCRNLAIPLVRTRGDIRPPRTHIFSRWLYGQGTRHHLVSADFLRPVYGELGVSQEKVTTLHGGTDLRLVSELGQSGVQHGSDGDGIDPARGRIRDTIRAQLGLSSDAFLVGMVARLSPVKGHSYVLQAVADLAPTHPNLELVFVGPEAQRSVEELREEARNLGLEERVHLVGRVGEPLEWAAAFDVAVIASTNSEAICRSAFEYLAVGTPMVASDLNAIGEVLDEATAELVPPGDVSALAAALGRLADSRQLRGEFSRRGRERAESEFSFESLGTAAGGLFAQIVRPD